MKFFIQFLFFALLKLLMGFPHSGQSTINGNNSKNQQSQAFILKLKTQVVEKLRYIQESVNQVHKAKEETEIRLDDVEGKISSLLDQVETKETRINYLESQIELNEKQNNELVLNLNSSYRSQMSNLSEKFELMKNKNKKQEEFILEVNTTFLDKLQKIHEIFQTLFRSYSCCDLRRLGVNETGTYEIRVEGLNIKALCDMDTEGGGWTVIQRRTLDGIRVNFTREWADYEQGFGKVPHSYWIGLVSIAELTSRGDQEIRFDMESFDMNKGKAYAKYGNFHVSGPGDKYRLSIANYSGNAGDSMTYYHNGMQFTTVDNDNDKSRSNCAQYRKGGWWYNACAEAHPNGILYSTETSRVNNFYSVFWYDFHSINSLKFMEMKIRNKNPAFCGL